MTSIAPKKSQFGFPDTVREDQSHIGDRGRLQTDRSGTQQRPVQSSKSGFPTLNAQPGKASTQSSTSYAGASNPWTSNCWGTNTFGFQPKATPNTQSKTDGKLGSGLLVDSSISEDWTNRKSQESGQPRPTSQSRFADVLSGSEPKSCPGDSYRPSKLAVFKSEASTTRPATIKLNAYTTGQTKPDFSSNFHNPSPFSGGEQAPNVYTKFDRVPPTSSARQNGYGNYPWPGMNGVHSPVEDQRSALVSAHINTSMPASRNGSLPPSRHSDQSPDFDTVNPGPTDSYRPRVELMQPFGQNDHFLNIYAPSPDHLVPQSGQMQVGNDSKNGAARPYHTAGNRLGSGPTARIGSIGDRPASMDQRRGGTHPEHSSVDQAMVHPLADSRYAPMSYEPVRTMLPSGQYTNEFTYGNRVYEILPGTSGGTFDTRRDSAHSRELQMQNGFGNISNDMSLALLNQGLNAHQISHAYQDPRLREAVTQQLRMQYDPYLYVNAATQFVNGYNPHFQVPSGAMTQGLYLQPGLRAIEPPISVRSQRMNDFLNNNGKSSRRYELKDIYDHVVEFCGDQHGSRFIQTKLDTANSEEKERLVREICTNAVQLFRDSYGNYVIQKLFDLCDQNQKKILASRMEGRVVDLSTSVYGCRVVQKALDVVLSDQQASIIQELEHNVLKCVKDQNGNHVVQKALERCPPYSIRFILDALKGQVLHLSGHNYGCRVIQRCLEHCEPADKQAIMQELWQGMTGLVGDQYGNYVVQHVAVHGTERDRASVLDMVANGLETFSRHKYASNVVEKCLTVGGDPYRRRAIDIMISANRREGDSMILSLIKDCFANYVIQKLLDVISRADYYYLIDYLQPELNKAKRSGCGKQVASIQEKMHRFHALGFFNAYSVPTASRTGSTHTTPPLTADTRSLQTSYPPSMNGDTSAGAADSRKASDQSVELRLS